MSRIYISDNDHAAVDVRKSPILCIARSGRRCEHKHIFRVRVRAIFQYTAAVTSG